MRDLCRARTRLVTDVNRARRRLSALLLRHGRVYRDGEAWTGKHQAWLAAQTFDQSALMATLGHYRAALTAREVELAALELDLRPWCDREPFADTVSRLIAYRGIAHTAALTHRHRGL